MAIISHPANKKYRDAYDQIFKKGKTNTKEKCAHVEIKVVCLDCGATLKELKEDDDEQP